MSSAETTRFATKDPGADFQARRIVMPQFGLEVGPLGHLAPERARLSQLTWERFDELLDERNPLLIEIEPKSKKIVWTFDQFDTFGNSVPNSQVLDVEGEVIR